MPTYKINSKKKKNQDLNDLKKEVNVDYHTVDLNVLVERLSTNLEKGLSTEKAAEIMEINGPNRLTPPKKTPEIIKYLMQFTDGFAILLTVGGILCFIAYIISYLQDKNTTQDNLYLGVVLVTVVIITATFGYYQESKSSKIMDSFKKLIPQESMIMRNGQKLNIPAEKIVLGDVVLLHGGDLIPADIRLFEANGLKVDNSSLTGESEPQKRFPENTNANLLEATNVVLAFTYAVEGTASGIVVSTGDNTVMGRIASLTSNIKIGKTPIRIELEKFVKLISGIAIVIGIIFFILSLTLASFNWITSVVFLIGIIVANVPEGLLVTVTLSLTLTAKKMAEKNCLIKNLESVETLGSTSVICSDKTGTLTQNRMTVAHLWYDNSIEAVTTSENTERCKRESDSSAYMALVKIAGLCNRADFRDFQDKDIPVLRLTTNGDASESALIKYVELFAGPLEEMRKEYKKVFEIPFNSINKYQVSIHEQPNDSKYLLVMKGAPERIIDRCTTMLINNTTKQVTDELKTAFLNAYEELGGYGERVLGFAQAYLPEDKYPKGCALHTDDKPSFSLDNLTFVGLMSMIDPPRAAVPHAVELCRSAGIKVVMVTGDHPITARAIAKNVKIITGRSETYQEMKDRVTKFGFENSYDPSIAAVITGDDIRSMSPKDLTQVILLHKEIVFARTSPQQKLTIVEGFQDTGAIVAVTGDGVNDSPALRKANIGIAMGICGSDVAKQAADMILLDDNFASIVTGVQQGRTIFDNLKKSIAYTLTSNIPEIAPFLIHIVAGIPLPIGTITILCIDLGTDMIPAISLAYEKAETDIMKRKPRNPKKDRLVNMVLINYSYLLVGSFQTLCGFTVYLFIMTDNGFKWAQLIVFGSWSSRDVLYVIDSFGQQWSFSARRDLEFTCYTAYFFAIVVVQWADLIISKTRKMSIIQHGILSNRMLVFGLFFETILAIIIAYVPFLNDALQTRPFHPKYLAPAFLYTFLLWFLDEMRRLYIRRNPGSFIERETYY